MQQQTTPSMSLANSNGSTHSVNSAVNSAPGSLTQQLASIAFAPMNNTATATTITPNSSIGSRFQALNTKPVTPATNTTQAGTPTSAQPVNLFNSPMAGAGANSLFNTATAGLNGVNGVNGVGGVGGLSGVTGLGGVSSLYQQFSPQPMSAGTASPKTVVSGAKGVSGVASPMT